MGKITHGVEQEIQIVDETGILENKVRELMGNVPPSLGGGKDRKFIKDAYDTQLEIVTGIATDLDELKNELIFLRLLGHEAADSNSVYLISTGTNPMTPSRPGENFGEHHHLGAPSTRDKVTMHNFIREFTAELMALTVNSPVYMPEKNTEFESFRATRNPHIGYSPRIDYDRYLAGTSLAHLRNKRYLDVSPFTKGDKPTVETRLFDVQLTVPRTIALAAIMEAIGLKALKYSREKRIPPRVSPQTIITNRSEARKHGLRARFVADSNIKYSVEFLYHRMGEPDVKMIPAWKAVELLLVYLEEEFSELGIDWKKDRIMSPVRESLRFKLTQADFQLAIFKEHGIRKLIEELIRWTKFGSMGKDIPLYETAAKVRGNLYERTVHI
jgi:gamma-glutamyl:cysteine ligase YbdK (ATP-grasp superfamily)